MAVTIGRGSFGGLQFDSSIVSDGEDSSQGDLSEDERIVKGIQTIEFNETIAEGRTARIRIRGPFYERTYDKIDLKQLSTLIGSIGTSTDSEQLRRKIHKILQDTSELTKQTGQLVKQYSQNKPEDESEQNEWKVSSERFRTTFQNVLRKYQAVQKETRVKERTSLRHTLVQSGFHDLEISDSGEITQNGQQVQHLEQIAEEENLKLIKEREEALKQLERDIVDVNDIFKDLAEMIQDQGEEITVIEENVKVTEDNIIVAVEELSQAHANVKETRKKKIAAAVILLVIIIIVIIIIIAVTV